MSRKQDQMLVVVKKKRMRIHVQHRENYSKSKVLGLQGMAYIISLSFLMLPSHLLIIDTPRPWLG